jgi:carboxymethylenebutenolidase
MCFDDEARPPLPPIRGAAGDAGPVILTAADGTRVAAYAARAEQPGGSGMVILPDVRGLHPYYEELACRFSQHGIQSLAIDYFGRTAGAPGTRADDSRYSDHMDRVTYAGLRADIRAAVEHLRSMGSGHPIFTIGFCFGGKVSFLASTFGLDPAGVIGVHAGLGPRNDVPSPTDVAAEIRSPVLGLFGGADPAIPPEAIAAFDAALDAAGVEHRFVSFSGAPHSFFDRKFTEFAEQNAAAWQEVLAFVGGAERVAA